MTLFGYDQGVFGAVAADQLNCLNANCFLGGVIVTQDFLNTLNLSGPEHTSLLGTVVALYDVGCFFGKLTLDTPISRHDSVSFKIISQEPSPPFLLERCWVARKPSC